MWWRVAQLVNIIITTTKNYFTDFDDNKKVANNRLAVQHIPHNILRAVFSNMNVAKEH